MAKSEKKKAGARAANGNSVGKPSKATKLSPLPMPSASDIAVLDRLYATVECRRLADPAVSHSARLMSRGTAKVAQKFGEEAVECVIEAVAGNHDALVAESADVLYHLVVLWVSSGVSSQEVWRELARREGTSGIAEKAARAKPAITSGTVGTSKIP
jgi:phosphoribosyl-ATP pyrophosphohydrolase